MDDCEQVFYEKDYNDWRLCSMEGEDESCSDQYAVDADVCKYPPPLIGSGCHPQCEWPSHDVPLLCVVTAGNHLKYLDFDFISNWVDCEL